MAARGLSQSGHASYIAALSKRPPFLRCLGVSLRSIRRPTHLTARPLVVGLMAIDFLVGIPVWLCAGHVYLLALALVTRAAGLSARGIRRLLLSNLMFILPLIGISVIAHIVCEIGPERKWGLFGPGDGPMGDLAPHTWLDRSGDHREGVVPMST